MNDARLVCCTNVQPDQTIRLGRYFPKLHFKYYAFYQASAPFPGKIRLRVLHEGEIVEEDVFAYWDRDHALHIPHTVMGASKIGEASLVKVYWERDNGIVLLRTSEKQLRLDQWVAERESRIWCNL